jgi:hypothetical protein
MKLNKHILIPALTFVAAAAQAAVGTLSGPFTHRNLQVLLVHGDAQLQERKYVTLSEALKMGYVVVKETGSVEELAVENLSKDRTVFIHAGDIVKGGRQDRTVRDDLILPPLSGKVPLATFCVEHGRWSGRGQESPTAFSANTKTLSSKRQKIAARYGLSQSEVWAGVTELQDRLNANAPRLAGQPVETRDSASLSSLQLTLESKELDSVREQYLGKLKSILDGKDDVIGFVYAINGEINSAEVYNHRPLFRALWPKLLDAAVTEAIAEYKGGESTRPLESEQLKEFFATAVSGTVKDRYVWKTTRVKIYTTPSTVLFETLDLEADGAWIHKSFINKGAEKIVVPLDRDSRQDQPRQPGFRR